MSRIEFTSLCKRYAPKLPLTINNANLVIEPGEFCVFVGPSGCGKSTLLRMVAGLEEITSGDLSIDGARVNDVPPAKRGVAMVFQSYALYPHMTVAENMAFGLKVFGADKAAIETKVKAAAEKLQLTPLLDRLPKALSGGQRQRVAIGRAIVKEPKVFLFDEPLSNLDAALRVQTRLEIARLHKQIGSSSMIYVTHDQVEAMTLADKIVLLHTGKDIETHGSIAQVGPPMTLYHHPTSVFVAEFLGSPKMNIVPATLISAEAGHARLRIGGREFDAQVDARNVSANAAVRVGVRPEHIEIVPAADANTIDATVQHAEQLGDSTLLYVDLGNGLPVMTVKLNGSASPHAVGARIALRFAPECLHMFGEDGRAVPRTAKIAG
jgi:multiple sugar transport system ATP-binding protein